MKPIFNPSLMCMDFLDIRNQLEILNSRVDLYHFDIMDGHYVPNITLSPDLAKAVAKVSDLPLDFHLMVTDPMLLLEPCRKAVAPLTERGIISYYSPHAEVLDAKAFRTFDQIRAAGFHPGVAINPETPLSFVMPYLHRLDKVTFMSVDPGFAGQPFIPEVMEKIREEDRIRINTRTAQSDRDWGRKENYDLCINSDAFGRDYSAALLAGVMKKGREV